MVMVRHSKYKLFGIFCGHFDVVYHSAEEISNLNCITWKRLLSQKKTTFSIKQQSIRAFGSSNTLVAMAFFINENTTRICVWNSTGLFFMNFCCRYCLCVCRFFFSSEFAHGIHSTFTNNNKQFLFCYLMGNRFSMHASNERDI